MRTSPEASGERWPVDARADYIRSDIKFYLVLCCTQRVLALTHALNSFGSGMEWTVQ